ncbi:hypothetical protein BT69DRAFT_1291232 [Atractiella rhizophila]|nr:hypothetical protein BT69DRAFT_1291232 [Atractiella rhizophila]
MQSYQSDASSAAIPSPGAGAEDTIALLNASPVQSEETPYLNSSPDSVQYVGFGDEYFARNEENQSKGNVVDS